MKLFTDCSGECRDCLLFYSGGCLAGHGDDDFVEITEVDAKILIANGELHDYLVEALKEKFPSLKNYKTVKKD